MHTLTVARVALLAAVLVSFIWTIQHCMSSSSAAESSVLEFTGGRKLLTAVTPGLKKKKMLEELEGAVLEPPTNRASRRTTRYLPDLMGPDSLTGYPRRVFLDVGLAGRAGSEGWFGQHYPKRDLEFEIIRVDEVGMANGGKEEGMTEWLRRNVRDEDYVVMKAEAEVVLEMVKGKAIGLVDELFLECSNQWHKGNKRVRKSRRAYWECLALYGRLRDEGIAVHQWWD